MNQHMIRWLAAVSFTLLGFVSGAHAQSLAANRDYVVIEPALLTDTPSKVEIIEFFSYACPHCSDLDPAIKDWVAKHKGDIVLRRIPVGFNNPFYQLMAKLFYTLEAIGQLEKLDAAVFNALHVKGLRLIDEKSILQWVTAQGVDAKTFSDAFNSFGVVSKTKRADQLAQSARIQGVPAIVVDGRYLVTGKDIKGHADLLSLTDRIIDMRRKERTAKK